MLNKGEVVRVFVSMYKKKIEEIRESLESTRKCAVDAPGSNVSRSDTSKFQYSNLALGIEKRLREAEEILKLLNRMYENSTSKSEVISIGSLVSLMNIDTREVIGYLLIGREGGGDSYLIGNVRVSLIYAKAPLAKMLNGRERGEEVEFLKKTFEIVEVQ